MRASILILLASTLCTLFTFDQHKLQNEKSRFLRVLEFKRRELNISNSIDYYLSELDLLEFSINFNLNIYFNITKSRNYEELQQFINNYKTTLITDLQALVIKLKSNELIEKKLTNSTGLLDDLLKDITEKVDSVLETDTFKNHKSDGQIETVIKLNSTSGSSSAILVDSKNNEYVLAKPGDSTQLMEDVDLLQDMIIIMLGCFLFVMVMSALGLPSFFGYILAGIAIVQLRIISNPVQVETISRGLGVMFIMFFLGLEFNLQKLKRVLTVSLLGSLILLILTVLTITLSVIQLIKIQESLVIGSCVFLSSTAVVMNFLNADDLERGYGRSIMGILVAQDVMLGFLIATMPLLSSNSMEILYSLSRMIALMLLFIFVSFILQYPLLALLERLQNTKEFTIAAIVYPLLILIIGHQLEQSMELSCFIAGFLVSSRPSLAEKIENSLLPLRVVFGALFFASIGLHIYPSFLYNEIGILLTLTGVVMIFKISSTWLVMRIVFRKSWKESLFIGVGLGQVLLNSSSAGIISKESFFLLIGVTIFSMILSPLLWKGVGMLSREDEMIKEFASDSEVLVSTNNSGGRKKL